MITKSLLAFGLSLALATTASAARHIDVQVIVNGEGVMTAPHSDNGHPNADQVWNSIQDVKFRLSPETDLRLTPQPDEPERYELPHAGTLHVQYGGRYDFKKIVFLREVNAQGQTVWKISPDQLSRWFDRRLIQRRDVNSLISNPAP